MGSRYMIAMYMPQYVGHPWEIERMDMYIESSTMQIGYIAT